MCFLAVATYKIILATSRILFTGSLSPNSIASFVAGALAQVENGAQTRGIRGLRRPYGV